MTGPDLIKGRTGIIEIGRGKAGMKDQKKERIKKIGKEERSEGKENKTNPSNCRQNQSRGS